MNPGDLVKLNERFFEDFGENPVELGGEFRRESRGILIKSNSNRNDGKLKSLKPTWYILWDSGMMLFSENWLERVEEGETTNQETS